MARKRKQVLMASVVGAVMTGPELQRLLLDPKLWTLGETVRVAVTSLAEPPKRKEKKG